MDNKFNDNIDVITIDDEEEEDFDNDIEIIEVRYCQNSSIKNPSIDEKPVFDLKETRKAETDPNDCSTDVLSNDSEERIPKSPRKIIATKVEWVPSTSVSKNSDTIYNSIVSQLSDNTNETNGVTPNKVQRIIEPKVTKTIAELDVNELYENYLKTFRDRMNAVNSSEDNKTKTEELINKLMAIVMQLKRDKPHFHVSKQFAKLMKVFAKDVAQEKDENRVVRHHNDLCLELNRMLLTPNSNGNKIKMSSSIKQKRIDKLTITLKKLQKEIFAAENEVLDYDAMATKSCYSDLPKLYKKLEEVWIKREELLKRSTYLGRLLYKKLKYNSTLYPDINTAVENLFNDYTNKIMGWNKKGFRDETFTFIDVYKTVTQVIKDKELDIRNTNELCESIYRDLLTELRERRTKESEDVFETLETLDDLAPETFVDNDPAIDIEISKNKSFFNRKMQDLFQKFTDKDREKNGESLLNQDINEWDEVLVDNEQFESIDVKDGDLDEEDSDDKNDEECSFEANDVQEVMDTEHKTSAGSDDNCLRDVTNS